MRALTRIYGLPLTIVFVAMVTLWVGGMIAAPLLTMVEKSLVFVDRSDDLTRMDTQINRLSRDIATLDLDIRIAAQDLETLRQADGNAGGEAPAAPVGGFMVPGMSVPSADNRPAAPAPSLGPSMTPSLSGGASAARTPDDIEAEIAQFEAQRETLRGEMSGLRERQVELRAEKADAPRYSLTNYTSISSLHLGIFLKTIFYAALVTIIAFALCYPVAYFATTLSGTLATAAILLLLIVPYAINELLRVYAWVMILEREGVLNSVLTTIGLLGSNPPRWVASNNAVFLVMAYTYMLFMMFPLINVLGTLDRNQVEAARDLGASVWRVHYRVVLPHAKPGIAMGSILVFMLSAGVITVPELVGRGLHPDWFSQVIYRRFFESANWNQGSAYSLMLLGSCFAFILMVLSVFRVSIREIAK